MRRCRGLLEEMSVRVFPESIFEGVTQTLSVNPRENFEQITDPFDPVHSA